ncbi:MAG TPA: Crp/Fnr family transcriptional regulator [Thermoanaerobaculaceae bacterium]|nr:Crp/Fnr family transcriptional regulator [Thermoanaerobaculaceae bacterium]
MASRRAALLDVLARGAFFQGLQPGALAEVVAAACERRVEEGEAVFREGEPADRFCVVTDGRLKLTQLGADGNEVILRFVGPGEATAALAIFEGTEYPLTARAVGPTSVLEWEREAVQALLRRHTALAVNTVRLLSERLREVQERFRELATERVAQRVARALLRLVRQAGRKVEVGVLIDLPLSRQDLAEMTGTTLFTVSRVLSEWEARGIIESGRERVTVTNPHGLVAIAEDLPEERRGKG